MRPALIPVIILLVACSEKPGQELPRPTLQFADRAFVNGAVYTVDANRSWAEAVAIGGGQIIAVGANNEVQTMIGIATDKECDLLRLPTLEDVQEKLALCRQLAGFGVLDRNLFEIPSAEISDAKVVMTVFDGDGVYHQEF